MKSFLEYKAEKEKILLEKDKDKNKGATPDPKIWKLWRSLINMSKKELEEFYNSEEGKSAGMSKEEAAKAGIDNGRESCRMLMKMIPDGSSYESAKEKWTPFMWYWARKQNSFNSRMRGMRKNIIGNPFERDGKMTGWLKSMLIWGHDPRKPLRKV
jgi:hypothetical protein